MKLSLFDFVKSSPGFQFNEFQFRAAINWSFQGSLNFYEVAFLVMENFHFVENFTSYGKISRGRSILWVFFSLWKKKKLIFNNYSR